MRAAREQVYATQNLREIDFEDNVLVQFTKSTIYRYVDGRLVQFVHKTDVDRK